MNHSTAQENENIGSKTEFGKKNLDKKIPKSNRLSLTNLNLRSASGKMIQVLIASSDFNF